MEIVASLAKDRRVEQMVQRICRVSSLDADLKDLCQMVYVILLEYDDTMIKDLWESEEINFFILRIILNQYRSYTSPYHYIFRKWQENLVYMGVGAAINDEAIEKIKKNFVPRRPKHERKRVGKRIPADPEGVCLESGHNER